MAEPIAIGLVGPLPPPSGGMANQTRQLARLLEGDGIAVEIVQVNPPYRPAWIERLRVVRAAFRLPPYLLRLYRCAGRVDLLHVMANSGWAWHLFAAPAVWIGRLRGIPVIVNYRGGEARTFLAREATSVRPTLRRATALIVPSRFLEEIFASIGVPAEIVPNIIDLARFRPDPSRSPGHHAIVTRNLEDIYDIPTALRAFSEVRRRHSDATLSVAGSGPARPALEALAHELGVTDAVRFTGRLDNERIAELYRSADLLVNPSTVDNMPISLLEAMASGIPIVSTDVGGIPHIVENGKSALLVPSRDPAAMADAMLRVFGDRGLAAALASAGLAAAESYTWTRVRPLLFDAYARATGRPPVRACTP
jgi:glycosyltransferase involved in cell wall biosynthesis